ncbi:MAG: two-component system response regulator [Verrucomicrobia bacterium]|nr:MAG: two-component system response regulator [Verrucomicrobiota bacterium]
MNPKEYVVLLADDDPNDVFLLQRAFQKTNIANPLRVVRDGEEAMAYLSGQDQYADRQLHPLPVLLLLDLKMPRKSGFEVLRWLRQQSGLKRLPVVVLTSSNQNPDINKAFDLGANSYIVKPGGFDSLVEMVKNLNLYWLILNEKPQLRGG